MVRIYQLRKTNVFFIFQIYTTFVSEFELSELKLSEFELLCTQTKEIILFIRNLIVLGISY